MHRGAHGDAPQAGKAELRARAVWLCTEPSTRRRRCRRCSLRRRPAMQCELLGFDHRDDVHGEGREGVNAAAWRPRR